MAEDTMHTCLVFIGGICSFALSTNAMHGIGTNTNVYAGVMVQLYF